MSRGAILASLWVALVPSNLGAQSAQVSNLPKRTVFSATGLPPGIAIDPYTGVISGTFDRAAIVDGTMTYDVTVNVDDINGGAGRTKIRITVPNKLPVATDDSFVVPPNSVSNLPVLANDKDGDDDPLVIVSAETDASPISSFGPSGIEYRANAKPGTTDTLRYVVSDRHGGRAVAYARVTVDPGR
jgi:hypothetical protein